MPMTFGATDSAKMDDSEPKQDDPKKRAHPNNPLHGVTLEKMLNHLVDQLGWEQMGAWVDIRCFNENPSISSSLKFLRKTPWARAKVERLYLESIDH